MSDHTASLRFTLPRTPRSAAIAGIIFSLLFSTSLMLARISIPRESENAEEAFQRGGDLLTLALNLLPYAGIAFLWFIGVLRDRLGDLEDRFFSTILFGSGLLFLAMTFVTAAVAGGILSSYEAGEIQIIETGVYTFGREVMFRSLNIFALRMAGVFMVSSGTIWVRTKTMPRGLALLTYALALILLLVVSLSTWIILVFPAWVMIISVYVLLLNYRALPDAAETRAVQTN